ncbi:CXXC-20-CXXC protein [Virgibacillus halotolerans]|uniref:TIGR04104 family putative zinc finger protein n=1 Tax=Virgibacillus halotolerans TaxID=1071053 RepID=UPI001961C2A7|nr:TIGR04104 family putative zinc finger protein [Virgibacillus halotolerans]MBM7601393.1 CXXC-20-CXXC protein [Virgibacillus halotolerans]
MAFNKKCCHCNYAFSYKTLLNQTAIMKCPACKAELQATLLSKIIFSLIFIIPFVLILMGIERDLGKIVVTLIWVIISFLVIQPLVLKYE